MTYYILDMESSGEGEVMKDDHVAEEGREMNTRYCFSVACPKPSDSPDLAHTQSQALLSEKDSSFEASNISGLEDSVSGTENNMSSNIESVSGEGDRLSAGGIGEGMLEAGEHLSGIGESITDIGENISGMVDQMMAEISPGVIDLSSFAGSSSAGDKLAGEGSDRDSDESETMHSLKQSASFLDAKQCEYEVDSLSSPHPIHRTPTGPFVMGDQNMDIVAEVSGKVPETALKVNPPPAGIFLDPSPLCSSLGTDSSSFANHSLMGKLRCLPSTQEKHSLKKLMDYQGLSSRQLPRQQKNRTDLTLADKVRLIDVSENTGKSQRSLAAEFHISVGSVNNILRRKREYREAFQNKGPAGSGKTSRYYCPSRMSAYNELHMLVLRWMDIAKVKVKPLAWPMVISKAREFAAKMNVPVTTLSVNWLENLHQSMDIPLRKMPVSARLENDGSLMTMWRKMLPFLVQGYQPENIFSVTETTLYYRCLPDCCFIGGPLCQTSHSHLEAVDHRLTVLLCCNSLGERLKPLIISSHACPLSLCGVPLEELPVVWCHQPHAAITTDIFTTWLRSLEASMAQQRRHIALFMDMTPSHLSSTLLKHVSLKFYLDDSAHLLQPLNQGVVRDFKAFFRRRMLQMVLTHASAHPNIGDVGYQAVKVVTELDAVFWIQEAWRSVSMDTIRACFQKAAFPQPQATATVGRAVDALPNDFVHLVLEASRVFRFTPMSVDVYAEFDSQLPCHHSGMEEWEATLLAEATEGEGRKLIKREPGDFGLEDASRSPTTPTEPVQAYEALESLSKLKRFSSHNIGLLTTVFELESLLLDCVGSSFRS